MKYILRNVRIVDKTRNRLYNLHCSHETTYRYTVVLYPFTRHNMHDNYIQGIVFLAIRFLKIFISSR